MTLYLDTSSLVKLYVSEPGSETVRQLVRDATVVATSVVAYPETRAAFARLRRERRLSVRTAAAARRQFDEHWPTYLSLDADQTLCRMAGQLAETYLLRGFDSIHLASFAEIFRRAGPTLFSSFDDRLNQAARRLTRKLSAAGRGR